MECVLSAATFKLLLFQPIHLYIFQYVFLAEYELT